MTVQFRRFDEVKGINDFAQQYSDQIYNATLAATTNTTLTVPGGGVMGSISSQGSENSKNKVYAVIRVSFGDEVWLSVGSTAAVPAGASFVKATSEIVTSDNPITKLVSVGDVLNFFTAGATTSVSVTFYQLPI